ncbi:PD-(D/E)XK nuclease family protein [Altererythrobacter sp. H2]|uniref:PD-(D/E)XK nuclease family protein n=1 Tax=Altererythrobacter sp. H2 TaxID=3108391 RepID=UPI002B4BBCD5|nr:PD-(D/E)XK nuclease family protein [Altererythrobacter sp. H2]WRK94927.1 PD-(D/E)XK nuclease family protein [Altererythrobacter sp. H2]
MPERPASRPGPRVYSIAAHRGFADALVAGLVPRYADPETGLARLTLLLPSSRAMRTVQEAFIRHFGEQGRGGLLMPRMAAVGDLDLDETLGSLLDPLGAADIPPACDPTYRWLRIAEILRAHMGDKAPGGSALLRLAADLARTMDRLLAEEIAPEDLLADRVLDLFEKDLSEHWQKNLHTFATVQQLWLAELAQRAQVDAAQRRNLLFRRAAARWQDVPPASPIVAAGVTSAAPALARLLRVVADLPLGSVVLPDLDLSLDGTVWDELGVAGAPEEPGQPPFGRGDAVTHPQYHLKLLLNRMGVAREEVQPWHRRGLSAADPDRSHALSSLFLPPEASKSWVGLPPDRRRLAGVRLVEAANPESEAQAIALLVREALEVPERRVAVVTPDRALARRVASHLRRWNVVADDSAGRPLSLTAAGRLLLLLAETAGDDAAPVPLVGLLSHPLVRIGEGRGDWLGSVRAFELVLRGPRSEPGLAALGDSADEAKVREWWGGVEPLLAPICAAQEASLAQWLDWLAEAGEALCGEALWAREDGRALARFVEDLREQAREVGTVVERGDLHAVLRDAMEQVAVRPPYGGHPRVAIYGLLEARMARADLAICAGLNEAVWPARPATDPLVAPSVLRALGVPGADFRIGLSAHDLAAMLGAPEVVLTRAQRDESGPTIPSRFLLRVRALLGEDLLERHLDPAPVEWAKAIDWAQPAERYPRPEPRPSPEQRKVDVSVTALDRLRSDPYQFYASAILRLKELEPLDAEPTPAWQGQLAHAILEKWHDGKGSLADIAAAELEAMNAHPLTRALWRPRLLKALEWVEGEIARDGSRAPFRWEQWGHMHLRGVRVFGRIDRLDRCADGSFVVIDYKTGKPPSRKQVEEGFALQLGTLGLIVEAGGFKDVTGQTTGYEYWSLGKSDKSETGFGYRDTPLLVGANRTGIPAADFLPQAQRYLDEALDQWILGDQPFTARLNPDAKGYATYDQLMRLDEWMGREE